MRRHDMPVAPGCFERGVSAERGGNRFCFASMVGTGRITRICSPASIRGNAKPQFGLRVPAASAFPTLAARWTIAPRTAVERKLDPPAPLPNPAANVVWQRPPRRRGSCPLGSISCGCPFEAMAGRRYSMESRIAARRMRRNRNLKAQREGRASARPKACKSASLSPYIVEL